MFTNERIVNAMPGHLVQQETDRIENRFLETACGNGNFLNPFLRRKLAAEKRRYGDSGLGLREISVLAVSSIHGVVMYDNAGE